MAITINGSGTITGISAGGLPDGSVTSDDIAAAAVTDAKLASTLDLSGKTVTLPSGTGGKVLQVFHAHKPETQSTASSTWADITNLSISVTPSSTSSKILVMADVNMAWDCAVAKGALRLMRDSTTLNIGNAAGSRARVSSMAYSHTTSYSPQNLSLHYLDTPSTTSATTYKLQFVDTDNAGYIFINRGYVDTDSAITGRTASNLVVMEIAG